jgi:hypothetical protein
MTISEINTVLKKYKYLKEKYNRLKIKYGEVRKKIKEKLFIDGGGVDLNKYDNIRKKLEDEIFILRNIINSYTVSTDIKDELEILNFIQEEINKSTPDMYSTLELMTKHSKTNEFKDLYNYYKKLGKTDDYRFRMGFRNQIKSKLVEIYVRFKVAIIFFLDYKNSQSREEKKEYVNHIIWIKVMITEYNNNVNLREEHEDNSGEEKYIEDNSDEVKYSEDNSDEETENEDNSDEIKHSEDNSDEIKHSEDNSDEIKHSEDNSGEVKDNEDDILKKIVFRKSCRYARFLDDLQKMGFVSIRNLNLDNNTFLYKNIIQKNMEYLDTIKQEIKRENIFNFYYTETYRRKDINEEKEEIINTSFIHSIYRIKNKFEVDIFYIDEYSKPGKTPIYQTTHNFEKNNKTGNFDFIYYPFIPYLYTTEKKFRHNSVNTLYKLKEFSNMKPDKKYISFDENYEKDDFFKDKINHMDMIFINTYKKHIEESKGRGRAFVIYHDLKNNDSPFYDYESFELLPGTTIKVLFQKNIELMKVLNNGRIYVSKKKESDFVLTKDELIKKGLTELQRNVIVMKINIDNKSKLYEERQKEEMYFKLKSEQKKDDFIRKNFLDQMNDKSLRVQFFFLNLDLNKIDEIDSIRDMYTLFYDLLKHVYGYENVSLYWDDMNDLESIKQRIIDNIIDEYSK